VLFLRGKKKKVPERIVWPKIRLGGSFFRNCTKSNELLAVTHWNFNGRYASLLERRAVG
jgi:hypothetical protein